MKTKQLYYEQPYQMEIETTIFNIEESGSLKNIILNETIFFPEGGGQPGDKGKIIGKNAHAKIEYTRTINGEVIHQGKVEGKLNKGDPVTAKIDWSWRYKYMKIHSAGHLIHDVLMTITQGLTPQKGSHGTKAFLEYTGSIDSSLKERLQQKVNEVKERDLLIITKETTHEELVKECPFIPANLPKDKEIRMIKIGDYSAMPDGGIQVKSTREIGQIVINDITSQDGIVTIKYRVFGEK